MRRTFEMHAAPDRAPDSQDLLLDLDDFEEGDLDGVAALSVHNEQLQRYLREF